MSEARQENESGGNLWGLVEVPCLVCGKKHHVLILASDQAKWKSAQITNCPSTEDEDDGDE